MGRQNLCPLIEHTQFTYNIGNRLTTLTGVAFISFLISAVQRFEPSLPRHKRIEHPASRQSHLDSERPRQNVQALPNRHAAFRKSRLSFRTTASIRSSCEFLELDYRFLQYGFEIFLGALLCMETDCIIIGGFANPQFTTRGEKIAFCFGYPLSDSGIHTRPCPL